MQVVKIVADGNTHTVEFDPATDTVAVSTRRQIQPDQFAERTHAFANVESIEIVAEPKAKKAAAKPEAK